MEISNKAKVLPVYHENKLTDYIFACAGCGGCHTFPMDGRWKFNNDIVNPTFSPSLKNTYPNGRVCHLFVRNGKIEYCGDCFHDLKGKTIEMELMNVR
ncbi:MAG: hypothetical protein IT280_12885 [Ignavibacteria bacterium]|nr:hypothetical protein [Ignavibacteria bacterium]